MALTVLLWTFCAATCPLIEERYRDQYDAAEESAAMGIGNFLSISDPRLLHELAQSRHREAQVARVQRLAREERALQRTKAKEKPKAKGKARGAPAAEDE